VTLSGTEVHIKLNTKVIYMYRSLEGTFTEWYTSTSRLPNHHWWVRKLNPNCRREVPHLSGALDLT
jgi:hypothetical protein